MDIFSVITLLGGLALFLYGMELMGSGLTRLSGGRMEKLLESMTRTRIMAVLLGLSVTAVIQSSSATTVMVVGFVNSGIMQLEQAVGIIMGANVGTTVTSWLLSLTGIQSDTFFLKLLQPSTFSPILAVIGIILLLFNKKEKKKSIGTILIGFAILMFGMESMSSSMEPLADMPAFQQIFLHFSNPLLGMLVGALLTAVLQSSSASVGILQALCLSGTVPYSCAIPIILGQNIGTCATALLSGIGASRNAKRASMIHLYFNVIGTLVFMACFYGLNLIFHFDFLNAQATPAGIALVHSCFNIAATVVWFPFANVLVKLARLTIRDKEEPKDAAVQADFARLDERFLDQTGVAVSQCSHVINTMADLTQEGILLALSLLSDADEGKEQRVLELEDQVDHYEDMLGTYMVRLSSRDLSEIESHKLSIYLKGIGEFERISDHSVNLLKAHQEMESKGLKFSKEAQEDLKVFTAAVGEVVSRSFDAFRNQDTELAKHVEPLEQVIDVIRHEEKQRHIERLREGTCTIELGYIFADISTDLERVSDHCSNLAVCLMQIREGGYDVHQFMADFRGEGNTEFQNEFHKMLSVYALPAEEG